MGDSLITIVAIALAAILMFIFPLMSLSERNDDISQLAVQTATTEFVDKVKTTGKLTLDDYQQYINTITATGNSFQVELQIQQLDENPGSKTTQAEQTKIGENVYYNKYTSQIETDLAKNGRITLKEGDIFATTVKNTNLTIAQILRNFFFMVSGNDQYEIMGQDAGVVAVNGSPR